MNYLWQRNGIGKHIAQQVWNVYFPLGLASWQWIAGHHSMIWHESFGFEWSNQILCSKTGLNTQQPYLQIQYIPRNMHTVFALLCFVVVIHWLIFPYPSGLLHWHCGNLTIAPVPAKQPWWIWINTSYELIMNDCITTTKQSTTKPCAYFLGYIIPQWWIWIIYGWWLDQGLWYIHTRCV